MKQFARIICLSAALGSSLCADTEPYSSTRLVSYEPYYFENSWILLNQVNAQSTTVFIDIESAEGMAARFIAANTSEDVKVYSINSWNENEHVFQKFLSNVIQEGLEDRVVPIRMSSKEGSAALNLVSELIYIDCNNSEEVSGKIFSWVAHLSEHGVIAGNKWEWPQVELAVVDAAVDLGLTLSTDNNFWFLRKN